MNRKAVETWAGPGKSKNPGGGTRHLLPASPHSHCTRRTHGGGQGPLVPSAHTRAASKSRGSSLLPGRGKKENPALGTLWNSPSSAFTPGWGRCDGGGVSCPVPCPVPCPHGGAQIPGSAFLSLPVPRSSSDRDDQLRLHKFNIPTGRELGPSASHGYPQIKVLPCTFLYISHIYI